MANRELFCEALDLAATDLVVPDQVHGTCVRAVGASQRGRGARDPLSALPATDGLLTGAPGVALFVSFADCVPVFIAAESAAGEAMIALVHAGWRGMLDGIIGEAARGLRRNGAAPRAAVVGPSICRRCFSVSDDLGGRFEEAWAGTWREGRVDLWAAALAQLEAEGLGRESVLLTGLCTCCDERFFSHRRDGGLTGRQAAIAWIRAGAEVEPRSGL